MSKVQRVMAASPLLALAMSCAITPEEWPREPFTPGAWKSVGWEGRYVYYESLVEQRLLDGATRERVIELLGKPDGKSEPDNLAYLVRKRPLWICPCSDIRVLDIRLDPDGRVKKYFVRGT